MKKAEKKVFRKEPLLTKRDEKSLEKGYLKMGKINVCLAEEGITADNEQLLSYEQKLSECEVIDY